MVLTQPCLGAAGGLTFQAVAFQPPSTINGPLPEMEMYCVVGTSSLEGVLQIIIRGN